MVEGINRRPQGALSDRPTERVEPGPAEPAIKQQYLDMIRLIERLHRRFLDVIKTELDRLGIEDINNVQTLILSNISAEQLTVGELTARGYYLGSNVSYNVKKLVENGYLLQERSPHDRRMTRVRLSQKGLDLTAKIDELYQQNATEIANEVLPGTELSATNQVLSALERYWSNYIAYPR
jgi:DNA-binding MarR family transcriptional regulator